MHRGSMRPRRTFVDRHFGSRGRRRLRPIPGATINLSLGSLFGHYVEFAIRPLLIIMLVVTALVVVMLSAHFPARRAASINAIEAIIAPWLRDCSTRAPTQPFRTAQRRGYGNCERLILPVGPRGKAGTNVIICGRL